MSRVMTLAFFALLLVTVLFWLATVATTATLNESDNAGNGLSYSFAMIGIFITWTLTGGLLLMAFRNVQAPGWTVGLAIVGLPLSGAAAVTVLNLLKDSHDFPAQWPIISVIMAPLLMMGFALWACVPSVRALVSPTTVYPVIWITLVLASIAPFPLRAAQKKRQAITQAEVRAAHTANEANEQQALRDTLDAFTDSTSLGEVLAFATNGNGFREEALARARALRHRQQDAIAMLQSNESAVMSELRNLNLEPSTNLCNSATEFLRQHAVNYRGRLSSNNNRFIVAAQELDKFMFGMQWLAEHGCSMRAALDAYNETALAYPDSPERAEFLIRLKHFATLANKAPSGAP